MRRLYGRQAAIYDWTRPLLLFGHRELLAALPRRPGGRALDFGCGTGRLLHGLADRVGPDGEVVGVDCVPEMAERARRKTRAARQVRVETLAGTALPDGPFDLVTAAYALTLAPDWATWLDRLAARLAPDGILGVLDFAGRPAAPIRSLFEAHAVEFGTERREAIRAGFRLTQDRERRAWGGLWRYFWSTGSRITL